MKLDLLWSHVLHHLLLITSTKAIFFNAKPINQFEPHYEFSKNYSSQNNEGLSSIFLCV